MNQNKGNQDPQKPNMGNPANQRPTFDKDQPQRVGQTEHGRDIAHDRDSKVSRPSSPGEGIPELDEPEVEGVGNEGGRGRESMNQKKQGGM
jgi:hypothetical protein